METLQDSTNATDQRFYNKLFHNVQQIAALGADRRSRRQLKLGKLRSNLKRTHNGWWQITNKLLGAKIARTQLHLPQPMSFYYRPGSTDLLVLEQIFLDGEYDVENIAPATVEYIVDLGSNIGVTAMLWAQRFPKAKMVLVEPDPDNFALLQQNTAGFKERCVLLKAAVSDKCGQTTFFRSAREYGHSILKTDDAVSEIRVETLTVPAILQAAGFPKMDLLKMDIEGGESLVMPAMKSWNALPRYILAELHPPYDLDIFADHCRACGLRATCQSNCPHLTFAERFQEVFFKSNTDAAQLQLQ